VADDDREKSEGAVSRRAFLKGGAAATGALSAALIPDVAEAQLPLAKDPDPRSTSVELKVNGVAYRKDVPNNTTLVQFLREDLKLTGTKVGCDRGMCGACTVVIGGRNVYSCMTLAVDVSGAEVLTIEGLGTADKLHPIQQAFIEKSGFQCGFCTSGQIMSTKALLDKMPRPSEDEARLGMSGNLCRCAAYKRILESVMTASRLLQA
jgi:aerobic-type carbon monoxide dehydrogenase small subunit (CoxS/CutS family)